MVTKSDEPDGNLNGLESPSRFTPLGTPPSKPPKHAIPAKPMSGLQAFDSTTSPTANPQATAGTSGTGTAVAPSVVSKKRLVTEEERQHAEKSLKSAMSRRLGDNMMSSLATKDLQKRLLVGIQCGVDLEVIKRAKKLLISVRKNNTTAKPNKKEVNASKYSGYHAAAASNDIEQEWSSKHLHLIEQAEKQKLMLDKRRHDEEQAMLLETEEGKEDFFDMMHTGKREHNQDEGGSVVPVVPVVSVDQSDDMTQQEAEEYMMFGALGRPAQQTDNTMAGGEGDEGHALVAFRGPPSTPPMTNMPSPKKSDNEDWRKIPKFISKTKSLKPNTYVNNP